MELVKVFNDDWCGLYGDGLLIQQGHSVNFTDFIRFLILTQKNITSYISWEYEDDGGGWLPEKLEDVKRAEEDMV